jgi:hypothetical protein
VEKKQERKRNVREEGNEELKALKGTADAEAEDK